MVLWVIYDFMEKVVSTFPFLIIISKQNHNLLFFWITHSSDVVNIHTN
jgi:hypothetical protein